jgi:hypothetical protein
MNFGVLKNLKQGTYTQLISLLFTLKEGKYNKEEQNTATHSRNADFITQKQHKDNIVS